MWRAGLGEQYRVALDLGDRDLQLALAEAIEAHPALAVAEAEEAPDLVIADGEVAPGPAPLLRLDRGPLPEQADPDLIVSAAHLMAAGFRLDRPEPAAHPPPAALSPRERQVLALMADGAPNKVIARTLAIAERTAKFHVAAILAKLHARNRSEAVAIALREGLVVF